MGGDVAGVRGDRPPGDVLRHSILREVGHPGIHRHAVDGLVTILQSGLRHVRQRRADAEIERLERCRGRDYGRLRGDREWKQEQGRKREHGGSAPGGGRQGGPEASGGAGECERVALQRCRVKVVRGA